MVKDAYQSEVLKNQDGVKTVEDYMEENLKHMEMKYDKNNDEKLLLNHYKINYGDISRNP
jgi:hypothetical protein